MTRLSWTLALGVALSPGCGDEKTTAHCGAACDIWAGCAAWDRAACMSQCEADGDWDQAYVDCLKARTCETLSSCG